MKFNKSLDWLKESDEENLLGDDELDIVDEELNEGLYVDPANYGNYDDLVDVVDKEGNPQKMTRDTYDKNRDSGEFKDVEPKEKEQTSGKRQLSQDFKDNVSKLLSSTELPGRPNYWEISDFIETEPAFGDMDYDEFKKTLLDSGITSNSMHYGLNDNQIRDLHDKAKRYHANDQEIKNKELQNNSDKKEEPKDNVVDAEDKFTDKQKDDVLIGLQKVNDMLNSGNIEDARKLISQYVSQSADLANKEDEQKINKEEKPKRTIPPREQEISDLRVGKELGKFLHNTSSKDFDTDKEAFAKKALENMSIAKGQKSDAVRESLLYLFEDEWYNEKEKAKEAAEYVADAYEKSGMENEKPSAEDLAKVVRSGNYIQSILSGEKVSDDIRSHIRQSLWDSMKQGKITKEEYDTIYKAMNSK